MCPCKYVLFLWLQFSSKYHEKKNALSLPAFSYVLIVVKVCLYKLLQQPFSISHHTIFI